jgi:hypothetical protein
MQEPGEFPEYEAVHKILTAADGPHRDETGTLMKAVEELSEDFLDTISGIPWCDDCEVPLFPVELFNKQRGVFLSQLSPA